MPKEGAEKLISAIAKALKREELDVNSFEDRLLMQKGCFILNEMGVSPKYSFGLYIRGPYSRDFADDYYSLLGNGTISYDTDVSSDKIDSLSKIMDKGTGFVEAYATIILARKYNPNMTENEIREFVCDMKPLLKKEIGEALEYQSCQ